MTEIATPNYPATAKVLVRGENQGRTALGIAAAYALIHPEATIDDMNRAFPREKFASTKKEQSSFITIDEFELVAREQNDTDELEFVRKVREGVAGVYSFKLGDGTDITWSHIMWGKENTPVLVEWAKQYDIYVVEFEQGRRGKLGHYKLEYLNGWQPQVVEKVVEKPVEVVREVEKKHIPWWVWLLAVILVGVIIALLCRPKAEPKVVAVTDTVVQTVVDTVYIQQLEEIEDHFNAAQFEKDKSDLSEDAKFVLHDLARLMNRNPELRLRIEADRKSVV